MCRFLADVAAATLMLVATPDQGLSGSAQVSGTLHIEQVQVAFLFSGNLGGGTLSGGNRKTVGHYRVPL